MFLRNFLGVVAILLSHRHAAVAIESQIESHDSRGSGFSESIDEAYLSLMQVAAKGVRSGVALEPVLRNRVTLDEDSSTLPQLPARPYQFFRLGWGGTTGSEQLRGSVPAEPKKRKGAGRLVFAGMLLCFFVLFGFFWDDSELQGLPPRMAERLLQHELWKVPAQVAAASSKTKVQQKSSSPAVALSNEDLPKLAPAFVGTTAGTVVSIAAGVLQASAWTVDVLGLMGVPILTAQLRSAEDTKHVLELRSRDGAPLVSVNSQLQIKDAGGADIGHLEPNNDDYCGFTFRSPGGSEVMSVTEDQHDHRLTMTSVLESGSAPEPLGAAVWCNGASFGIGGERISGDRLEVSAKRGVDVVLMLVCTLAVSTFGSSCRQSGKQALGT